MNLDAIKQNVLLLFILEVIWWLCIIIFAFLAKNFKKSKES